MTRRQALFWLAAVIVLGALSVLLSSAVRDAVILPVLKLLWLLKGYYGSVHQLAVWSVVVAAVVVIAALSLRDGELRLRGRSGHAEKFTGEVRQLAFWIQRARHGPYPRWYLARTLAEVAREFLHGRGENVERGGQLKGPEWAPPGEVQEYLQTALQSTPATFARQLESARLESDPEAETIVSYLETYAENTND